MSPELMLKAARALVAVSLFIASTSADAPAVTFIGSVDARGLLTPFAVYDGDMWWNRWPSGAGNEKIRNLPVPPSLTSIPAEWLPDDVKFPVSWQAFRANGALIPFRALRPARPPDSSLMDTFVIETTYRGRKEEDEVVVAIAGPGVLGRLVTPQATEQDAILRQLRCRIAALEAAEIARWRGQSGEKSDLALTRTHMVDTPAGTRYVSSPPPGNRDYGLIKAAGAASTVYYLRDEKLFRLHPEDECTVNLLSDGFVTVNAARTIISERIASFAYSEYCGDAAEMSFPLATITIGGRTLWIERINEEDGYDYTLIDPLTGEPTEIKGRWGTTGG